MAGEAPSCATEIHISREVGSTGDLGMKGGQFKRQLSVCGGKGRAEKYICRQPGKSTSNVSGTQQRKDLDLRTN